MQYTAKDFYMMDSTSVKRFSPFNWFKKIYFGFLFLKGCVNVIKNPYNTDLVIRAAQGFATPKRFEIPLNYLKSQPGGIELLEKKPLFSNFNLQNLSKLPSDTLGFQFAEHMKKNNLDPNFFDVTFSDDITYLFYRYGKMHDILHVITGFDTSIQGEMGVLTYSYYHTKGPGLILVMVLILLHGLFHAPQELDTYIKALIKGWRLGEASNQYYTADWDRFMNFPLTQVRKELNIEPIIVSV